MKTIPLTKGYEAIVDDEDYEYLNQFKWYTQNRGYAARSMHLPRKMILMHRQILNISDSKNQIDHIDGNRLNNQKINLRIVTNQENQFHRNKTWAKSGFKGVYWNKRKNKWLSAITLNGTQLFLGYFDNKYNAAKAYNEKAKQLFGKYAKLNEV